MATSSRDQLLAPILAGAALVVLAMTQLALPLGEPLPEANGVAVRRPRPVKIPAAPDSAALLAAPLFAPNRTPAQADAGAGGSLDSYAVLGVAVGRNTASAVLSSPGDPAQIVLRRGESVKGWRLVAVSRAKVTFERNGVERSLIIGAAASASDATQTNTEETEQ